ncbi:MAG: SIS domain-containing protein [Chloroflexi bacterium]|nr:SIS domain-containing protein [Chloroflexota bacterium]
MNSLQEYFEIETRLFSRIPFERVDRLIALLERARTEGQRIFLFGNGGSAATASHFACDLGKGTVRAAVPRFKVIALNDNMATFSAYANDQGYESVFAEPLISLAERGDIAIAFSGSGNSPNVLRAMQAAQARGLMTVGFTGFQGGKLKDCVELEINVPSDLMAQIEDVHLALTHAVCEMLKISHQ